ncbi:MAG: hypothetical protein FWG73_00475 [Planctomycetaceae bacterium]|nr:hypothetical protein [Planctomycetaceae bacterium]
MSRKKRDYLGAPHSLFTEIIETTTPDSTVVERIPMFWADSISVTPFDDHYRGVNGKVFLGDDGNPQMLHFKTARLHVYYSNDSIHYSRIKCSWR